MNPQLLLLLALISVVAMIGNTQAATRIALVGAGNGVENVLDAATALMSKDTDLQLLDRAEVGRVLREQEISLAGLVRAELSCSRNTRPTSRSEERRVGKECRSRWSPYH